MKRAEEGKEKKVSFCRTLLLACWNRFYTQFDMLLSKKHRQSWDYHLVLAKLPSFFAEQVEMQVYIIYAIFCTPKQLIHTECKHTKNRDSLLGKKIENSQQSLSKVSVDPAQVDPQQDFSRGSGILFTVNLSWSFNSLWSYFEVSVMSLWPLFFVYKIFLDKCD